MQTRVFQMQKQLESDRARGGGKWEILATEPNRRRLAIGVSLIFFNQLTVSPHFYVSMQSSHPLHLLLTRHQIRKGNHINR